MDKKIIVKILSASNKLFYKYACPANKIITNFEIINTKFINDKSFINEFCDLSNNSDLLYIGVLAGIKVYIDKRQIMADTTIKVCNDSGVISFNIS